MNNVIIVGHNCGKTLTMQLLMQGVRLEDAIQAVREPPVDLSELLVKAEKAMEIPHWEPPPKHRGKHRGTHAGAFGGRRKP